MQLSQLRMANEYFIHAICLLILPTEMVWSLYGIIKFYINRYDLSDLPNKVTYCNWGTGMVFNGTENYKFSHNHNIVNLFPLCGRPLKCLPIATNFGEGLAGWC